jgi:ribosome-binding factor A
LQGAAGFVRRELGRRMRLRLVPEIEFRYDKGLDAADRVARLLQEDEAATAAAAKAAAARDEPEPEPEPEE